MFMLKGGIEAMAAAMGLSFRRYKLLIIEAIAVCKFVEQ